MPTSPKPAALVEQAQALMAEKYELYQYEGPINELLEQFKADPRPELIEQAQALLSKRFNITPFSGPVNDLLEQAKGTKPAESEAPAEAPAEAPPAEEPAPRTRTSRTSSTEGGTTA